MFESREKAIAKFEQKKKLLKPLKLIPWNCRLVSADGVEEILS